MSIIHKKQNTGFTLIELLVSIALFSVVLTATLGSIMTIVDSNRKARSLMSVTNNLNFAVDAMVRSFKTGEAFAGFADDTNCSGDNGFTTLEIDYAGEGFAQRQVKYCFVEVDGMGKITKDSGSGAVDLTASDVDIDHAEFVDTSFGNQPMLMIVLRGTVRVSPKVSSEFSIQTSVSQRKLNIPI